MFMWMMAVLGSHFRSRAEHTRGHRKDSKMVSSHSRRECLNIFPSFTIAVCRSPMSLWFCIDHHRRNLLDYEHRRARFCFVLGSQYCIERSSYWPKTPDSRNWLTFLAVQTMTCSSSLNTPLFEPKPTKMSFVDQALSNDIFVSVQERLASPFFHTF